MTAGRMIGWALLGAAALVAAGGGCNTVLLGCVEADCVVASDMGQGDLLHVLALVEVARPGVGPNPGGIAAADVDEDGRADLVVFIPGQPTIITLLNDGQAPKSGPLTSPVTGQATSISAMAVGRFDGDAHLDVVTTDSVTSVVTTLAGDGTGHFHVISEQALVTPMFNFAAAEAADFDGDGHLDVVMTSGASGSVIVLLGQGNGSFAPYLTANQYAFGSDASSLVVADFDRNGTPDVAVTNARDNSWGLFSDMGAKLLSPSPLHFALPMGLSPPRSLVAGDFNGDGALDVLIATGVLQGSVVAWLSRPAMSTYAFAVPVSVGRGPAQMAARDFDGDGRLDAVVSIELENSVAVVLGLGDGRFAPPLQFAVGRSPMGLASADFDGDGVPDVAVTNVMDGTVTVLVTRRGVP